MGDEKPDTKFWSGRVLPEGWKLVEVGGITKIFNGKAAGKGGTWLRVFKTRHVYDGFVKITDPVFVPDERATRVPKSTYLQDGDTLTPNMAHGTIGRVAYVPRAGENWTVDGQITVLRSCDSEVLLPRFLFDAMSSRPSRQGLLDREKGGAFGRLRGQTHLYKQDIATIKIPLPPLPEQRKIAAILSSVDETIEKTEAVIAQLQVVKKAMMQALLTRGLPGRHTRFKKTELGDIPEEWELRPLHTVAQVQTGIAKGKKADGDAMEVSYLRVANVQDGFLDLRDIKTLSVDARALERYALQKGDVLFTEGGDADKLGRGCVWHVSARQTPAGRSADERKRSSA